MDLSMDLGALLSQLQTTQQARSSAKLSERNVVELINKLRQLGILAEGELLHTINGREYLTQERLKADLIVQLRQAGGRVSLVELPALLGVDYVHCERQAAAIVSEGKGDVLEVQGELINTQYFDSIAAEINEQLQESGQLHVGELAAQYGLATELVVNFINARLGAAIDGRLEGGLLYTPAFLRNIKAQLRGALRGSTMPLIVGSILKELGLDVGSLGGAGGVVVALVEELVQEGSVRGVLKGGGTSWLPAVHAEMQQGTVTSFYNINGWVLYETVKRLGIPNEKQYLRQAFPDGLALDSAHVAPAVAAQLDASVEEAVAAGGWVDVAPLLPAALQAGDVSALVGRVAVLKDQERRPPKERKAHLVGGTLVLSAAFVTHLQEKADAEARARAYTALQERRATPAAAGPGPAAGAAGPGGGGKKKGGAADDDDDDWSMGPSGKKGAKKKGGGGKGGAAAAAPAGGAKGGGIKGAAGGAAQGSGLTVPWLANQLREWQSDMEWGGEDGEEADKAAAVAALLLPGAITAYEQALQAAFTAGAEERRRAKDALAKQYEEAYGRLLLYGHGAELFSDDEATYTTLVRHALRTTGSEVVDLLHRHARLDHGDQQEQMQPQEAAAAAAAAPQPLSAAERTQIARQVPPDVGAGLSSASDALNAPSVREAEEALDEAAAAVGMRVRKLDKKGEKAALSLLRDRLLCALSSESDPPAALPLMVTLALIKATGKAVTLPGKALGAAITMLKNHAASHDAPEAEALSARLVTLYDGVVSYLKAQSTSAPTAEANALLESLTAQLSPLKAMLGLGGDAGDEAAAGAPATAASG